jgi:hypothetical protein
MPPRRLLDQVRDTTRHQGHTKPAVLAMADWCERFIRFNGKEINHPINVQEVTAVLTRLGRPLGL